MRSILRAIVCACACACLGPASGVAGTVGPAAPLLTILDGDAVLLRASDRFALGEGVALQPDDIVDVPATSHLARLEYPDGTTLAVGPDSRVMLAPRLSGARAGALVYVLSGWAKLAVPRTIEARLLAPALELATTGGTVVVSPRPGTTWLFVESGDAVLRRHGAGPQRVEAGQPMTLSAAGPTVPSLDPDIPRAFMDSLPTRAAWFREHPAAPRKLGKIAYADVKPWLDTEPDMRRANVARWGALARDPEWRRGLTAELKTHPEWRAVLAPPAAKAESSAPPPPKKWFGWFE